MGRQLKQYEIDAITKSVFNQLILNRKEKVESLKKTKDYTKKVKVLINSKAAVYFLEANKIAREIVRLKKEEKKYMEASRAAWPKDMNQNIQYTYGDEEFSVSKLNEEVEKTIINRILSPAVTGGDVRQRIIIEGLGDVDGETLIQKIIDHFEK